jgi:ATP-dependent DNA helicase Q4
MRSYRIFIGQYEAIERVLRLESTLLLVPTGGGKSLTYQLPAKLLNTRPGDITLVITPLISLMQDQLANLPPFLPGACLGSHQRVRVHSFL